MILAPDRRHAAGGEFGDLRLVAADNEQRFSVWREQDGVRTVISAAARQDTERLDRIEFTVAVGVAAAIQAAGFAIIVVHDVETVEGPHKDLSAADFYVERFDGNFRRHATQGHP